MSLAAYIKRQQSSLSPSQVTKLVVSLSISRSQDLHGCSEVKFELISVQKSVFFSLINIDIIIK